MMYLSKDLKCTFRKCILIYFIILFQTIRVIVKLPASIIRDFKNSQEFELFWMYWYKFNPNKTNNDKCFVVNLPHWTYINKWNMNSYHTWICLDVRDMITHGLYGLSCRACYYSSLETSMMDILPFMLLKESIWNSNGTLDNSFYPTITS